MEAKDRAERAAQLQEVIDALEGMGSTRTERFQVLQQVIPILTTIRDELNASSVGG